MTDDERSRNEDTVQSGIERARTSANDDAKQRPSHAKGLTVILWALASNGLLVYVAFGSTPAYIWRFNRKHQEFKSVLGTWRIEANNLPQVSQQWLLEGVFYGALLLFLLGAIAGLWFLLEAGDEGMSVPDPAPSSSPGAGTMST